jgi:5-carboxymethyl-2-hydroxymuconate isomerase
MQGLRRNIFGLTIVNVLSTCLPCEPNEVNAVAHLTVEYSANLDEDIDIAAFCEVLRAAMAETGTFPVAGIRVRAYRADHVAVGDGGGDLGFADLVLRMGPGRNDVAKQAAVEAIYAAAENWLRPQVSRPFALSLELTELNYPFAEKRMNTIRAALVARGVDNA